MSSTALKTEQMVLSSFIDSHKERLADIALDFLSIDGITPIIESLHTLLAVTEEVDAFQSLGGDMSTIKNNTRTLTQFLSRLADERLRAFYLMQPE